MGVRLVLATTNRGKIAELDRLLSGHGVEVVSARDLGFDQEVPETGETFADNALLKARAVSRALDLPALADDSGLVVEALVGRPGVYSARYAGPEADDAANNAKLLAEMAGVPPERRGAAFVCAMCCALPGGGLRTSEGRLAGRIALAPRGEHGFGYDPVFELPGRGLTVAQLSTEEKNAISHRGQALARMAAQLRDFLY